MTEASRITSQDIYGGKTRGRARLRYLAPTTTSRKQMMNDIGECVYFLLSVDRLIKIGYSKQFGGRFGGYGVGPQNLLFVSSGTIEEEAALHERFRPYRARGREYYRQEPELLDYIDELRVGMNLPLLTRRSTTTD